MRLAKASRLFPQIGFAFVLGGVADLHRRQKNRVRRRPFFRLSVLLSSLRFLIRNLRQPLLALLDRQQMLTTAFAIHRAECDDLHEVFALLTAVGHLSAFGGGPLHLGEAHMQSAAPRKHQCRLLLDG